MFRGMHKARSTVYNLVDNFEKIFYSDEELLI